jgi:aminoglycoside phosphotransferase (APT) family kinase protein
MAVEPAASPPATATVDAAAHEVRKEMTTTAADVGQLRLRLQEWFSAAQGRPVRIGEISRPPEGGMSSISLLFDAAWESDDGAARTAELVARMAPEMSAVPVFPHYDLRRQHDVIAAVAAASDVPVPALRHLEESPEVLGSAFVVMDRVSGRVPVDNPPYVFFGWLFDAAPEQRRQLQDSSIELLSRLHAIPDPLRTFPALAADIRDGDALRSHVAGQRAYYEWTRRDDGLRIPVIEDGFDWLDRHWPAEPGDAVLSWGDARIGNVIYDGFRPVAVLDWEMAALGPRELDLAWFIFIHRFFQDIAEMFDQPGLPDMCRRDDVVDTYQAASGHAVRDLDFYLVYAALRHAVVMSQVKRRMIHFGEDTTPDTSDEYVLHHATLRAMIDGSYDWTGR